VFRLCAVLLGWPQRERQIKYFGSSRGDLLTTSNALHLTWRPQFFTREEHRLGFDSKECAPDAFEVEYLASRVGLELKEGWADEVPVAHLRITKEIGKAPVVHWMNRGNLKTIPKSN